MEDQLEKLIELLLNLAPEVWAVMQRQVYVNIVQNTIGIIIGISIILVLIKVIRAVESKFDNDDIDLSDEGGYRILELLLGIVILFAFILTATTITNTIGMIINPDYYAIKLLLNFTNR